MEISERRAVSYSQFEAFIYIITRCVRCDLQAPYEVAVIRVAQLGWHLSGSLILPRMILPDTHHIDGVGSMAHCPGDSREGGAKVDSDDDFLFGRPAKVGSHCSACPYPLTEMIEIYK